MRIKEIEARIAKLERSPRFSPMARMSDDELERVIVRELNALSADYPSFGAMVSDLRESPSPEDQDLAGRIEAFIADWTARHPQPAR